MRTSWRARLARNRPTTRTGWALIVLWTIMLVLLGIFITSYFVAPFGEYPLLNYLPMALVGFCAWWAGLVQLVRADLKLPQWGNRSDVTTSYAGYGPILAGTLEVVLPLSLVFTWQNIDIYIGGFVAVTAYLTLASVVGGALDRRARRRTQAAASGTTEAAATQPLRIARRTLLMGAGVVGAEVIGVGWLISKLPSLVPLQTFPARKVYGSFIAWAPDSRRLASNTAAGVVQVWDATTGAALQRLDTHLDAVFGVAWAPDDQRLAIGLIQYTDSNAGTTIEVWDVGARRRLLTHAGGDQFSSPISWRPLSDNLLVVADDGIHIWNSRSGHDERLIPLKSHVSVYYVAWSPDGAYLAGLVNEQIVIWDIETTRQVAAYSSLDLITDVDFISLAWSPDGRRLAAGDRYNTMRTWDALTGVNVYTYAGPIPPKTPYPNLMTVNAVAWSPDSAYVAAASEDTTVRIWRDGAEGQRQPVFVWNGHLSSVKAVAWAPDGQRIASGNWNGAVQVWRPQGDLWG